MTPDELTPLLQRARELQTRLASLQSELAARRFEGAAGGGMVTAVVTGGLRVVEIRIEPSLVAGGDRDMLQDLTAAAVNAALAAAQAGVQEELRRASAGFRWSYPRRCSVPCTIMCAQWAWRDLPCSRASRATTGAQMIRSPSCLRPSTAVEPGNARTLVGLSLSR